MLRSSILIIGALTAISLGASGAKDTVISDPARPTINDAVTFYLFNHNICCCAEYFGQTVTANDTAMLLSYAVDTQPCLACRCFALGSTVSFDGGPFKAGTYNIYKVENPCAPGMICPLILPLPVLVGKVTVSEPTTATAPAIARAPARDRMDQEAFAVDIRGRMIAKPLHAVRGTSILWRGRHSGSIISLNTLPSSFR